MNKYWKQVQEVLPQRGLPVLVCYTNPDTGNWKTDVAYYCDHGFYNLQIDPEFDVLRKHFVSEKVVYWTDCIIPSLNYQLND